MNSARLPRISAGMSESVIAALYMRDTYRLAVVQRIPLLSPRVDTRSLPTHVDEEAGCREWNEFWSHVSAWDERSHAPPKHPLIDQSKYPTLAELSAPVQAEMLAYASLCKRKSSELGHERFHNHEMPELKVLANARPRLFRPRRDVSLAVTLLPVERQYVEALSSRHVLVSFRTYQDPHAYELALRQTLGWRK
jgi:hypothetical protein